MSAIPEYFTKQEINFLAKWAFKTYDPKNKVHKDVKEEIMATLGHKTGYWADQVKERLKGYDVFKWRMWSQKGWDNSPKGKIRVAKFKHYTWARIFKIGDDYKDIFFTVGVDGYHKALVYKLDYYFQPNSELTKSQQRLCEQLIPEELHWITIPFKDIPKYNWESLVDLTVDFIQKNEKVYDDIINSVWSGEIKVTGLNNRLIKVDTPKNGFGSVPVRNPTFKGRKTDWKKKHQEAIDIGAAGENLVVEYEKKALIQAGKPKLAAKVHKVDDGNGYDIESRYENGDKKYIEVKTTGGTRAMQFDITLNEVLFSEFNKEKYHLYRLYKFDPLKNLAEFHDYYGSVRKNFLLEEISFTAYKKEE